MAKKPTAKRTRMHLRLDAKTKHKLERAAAYEETSVTEFVLAKAIAAAEQIIDAREKIVLSAPDWALFYDALIHPPKPNQKLKNAARRYRERIMSLDTADNSMGDPHTCSGLRPINSTWRARLANTVAGTTRVRKQRDLLNQ